MSAVAVASMVEDGNFYVVMAETSMEPVPGRGPGIKRTTLTVSCVRTALGIALLDEGEKLDSKDLFTQYVAGAGGLFWEYAGRRMLDECVAQRQLTQSQVLGYEARYQGGTQ